MISNQDLMELSLEEIHALTNEEYIVLYHLSRDTDIDYSEYKIFKPYTPTVNFPLLGEDDTTHRISLSSTLQGCFNGINPNEDETLFALYPVVIKRDDIHLITPNTLYTDGKVPDALYTKEYWYTAPLELYPLKIEISNVNRIEVNDKFLEPTKEIVDWLLEENSNNHEGKNILPELINKLDKCNDIFDISDTHSEDILKVVIDFDIEEIVE